MSNSAIQIKRGPGKPSDNVLQPYELGFDTTNGLLYIGDTDGKAQLIANGSDIPLITIAQGGTGATNAEDARSNLGINYTNLGTAAIANGGTGATTAANARSNLGINYANLGIVPIAQGGTGANTKEEAMKNLGNEVYIIAEGDSDIWHYRKWSNGIAECIGTTTTTQAVQRSWGEVYIGGNSTAGVYTTSIPYPFTFKSVPTVLATHANTGQEYSFFAYSESSVTQSPRYQAWRPATATNLLWGVTMYVIGEFEE